jgi:uroporphyrinogen-III synthase
MTDLQGRHILITRPEPQGSELCRLIEAKGGQAICMPTLAFAPPPDSEAFDRALAAFGDQDWLIFISPQAVLASVPAIRRQWPLFPTSVQFACVGEGTAKALLAAGYRVSHYPEKEWNSEGLLDLPCFQSVTGKKIAIIRGEGGRELVDKTLAARGATILPVIAYQRVLPELKLHSALAWLEQHKIDSIVCTSFESVKNLKILWGEEAWPYLKACPLYVVSERIKGLAHDLGFQTIWVTHRASNESILETLMGRT